MIHKAISHWEKHTCLQFLPARQSTNYIDVIKEKTGCFSSSVGMRGGRQVINLGRGCLSFGIIIHEFGHAIGFWHEQNRPDRDNYVTIKFDNIGQSEWSQFIKLFNVYVDYYATEYDYGSIMHYSTHAFSNARCRGLGCRTIVINNATEYQRQGSPRLGQKNGLSSRDILQANRLYSCAGKGVRGFLVIKVKQGSFFNNTYQLQSNLDLFVVTVAIDSSGKQFFQQTQATKNTQHPVWNEIIFYGYHTWQFFRISVWDVGFHQLTMSQSILIENDFHYSLQNCNDKMCNSFILFDYSLDVRTLINARLRVNIHSASHLIDTDLTRNKPDPYVRIEAVQSNAITKIHYSETLFDSTNPSWNQWIDLGCKSWNSFFIQILDEDLGIDDKMSDRQGIVVYSGVHTNLRHIAYGSGHLIYDYDLVVDGIGCTPSPCQNGGSCVEECASYTCNCHMRYVGKNCQYHNGHLSVTAHYGRNIAFKNGSWNNIHPYMEFIGVDAFGYSERMTTTEYLQDDRNPIWNEVLNFTYRAWRQLKVRVYNGRWGSDNELSALQNVLLSMHGKRSNVRHVCYNGYTVFDYSLAL